MKRGHPAQKTTREKYINIGRSNPTKKKDKKNDRKIGNE